MSSFDPIHLATYNDPTSQRLSVSMDVSLRELFESKANRDYVIIKVLDELAHALAQHMIATDASLEALVKDELRKQIKDKVSKRVDEFIDELAQEL